MTTPVTSPPRHIAFPEVLLWAKAHGIDRRKAVREFVRYLDDHTERCVWCGRDVRTCDGYACGGKERA